MNIIFVWLARLVLACVTPLSIYAQTSGQVRAISASPAPAFVGGQVTVTVDGIGECKQVGVRFGDGNNRVVNVVSLPYTLIYTYSAAGTFTLNAIGISGCQGNVTSNLTVSQPSPAPPPSGKVTEVKISPIEAIVGQTVTVTVAGINPCGLAEITLGSGALPQTIDGPLPRSIPFKLSSSGTTLVTAKGKDHCSGQASAQVTAKSALAELCKKVNCSASGAGLSAGSLTGIDVCPTPKVTNISAAPPLEPGEELVINGSCLGTSGELRLVGNFPAGHLNLEIIEWHPHAIAARVPGITGVQDMGLYNPARMQVVRKDLALSNQIPIAFRAARDVIRLNTSDVSTDCSNQSDEDHCQWHSGTWGLNFEGATLSAHHRNGMDISDDCGTDFFKVSLRNGWTLHKAKGPKWWTADVGDLPWKPQFTGYKQGAASANMKVKWCVDPENVVEYKVKLYAIGPVGVAYK